MSRKPVNCVFIPLNRLLHAKIVHPSEPLSCKRAQHPKLPKPSAAILQVRVPRLLACARSLRTRQLRSITSGSSADYRFSSSVVQEPKGESERERER